MGGPGNRTHYPGVTSAMLYQLSYRRTTGCPLGYREIIIPYTGCPLGYREIIIIYAI